jgi:predicted dinucleotide-binding enzyme
MKVGILGTGIVGQTHATRLNALGHDVMMGTRNVNEKLSATTKDGYGGSLFLEWYKSNKNIKLGTFAEATAFAEIVINVTNGMNSLNALKLAEEKNLNGKILIDITNPLDFSKGMPPSLISGLSNTNSLGEEIQKTFHNAIVVKTLNTITAAVQVNPNLVNNGDHTNFLCGNNAEAKQKVIILLKEYGWKNENILDLGDITCCRAVEAWLPLWLRIWTATQSPFFNLKIVKQ